MACCLLGAKPLFEPMLEYCHLEQTLVKFLSKLKNFIQENALESVVCEMAAILSRGRWVNPSGAETRIVQEN